jgi:hypothetical protein
MADELRSKAEVTPEVQQITLGASIQDPAVTPQMAPGETLTPEVVPPVEGPKALTGLKRPSRAKKELTRKNRAFLELLLSGKPTQEAYTLAGYKGGGNAPYVLRSELKWVLQEMLAGQGLDRVGLKMELKKLLALPVIEMPVTVEQRLKILKFMDKLTEDQDAKSAPISGFHVEINSPSAVNITGSQNGNPHS